MSPQEFAGRQFAQVPRALLDLIDKIDPLEFNIMLAVWLALDEAETDSTEITISQLAKKTRISASTLKRKL